MQLTRAEEEWLEAYRRELVTHFPDAIERMLIYGSKARGDAGPDSDLDVLLIVHDDYAGRKGGMRRIGYVLGADGDLVPSIFAYTTSAWNRLRQSGSRFRKAVERDEVRVL